MYKVPKGKRREAFDRRMTAIHEAGHFTVVRHFGLIAYAGIWDNYDPQTKEIFFLGQCVWWGDVGLTPMKERMISVAGVVAEKLWHDPKGIGELLNLKYWGKDAMSPSDWMGCRCEPGVPDHHLIMAVEHVARLFDPEHGKLWPQVGRLSRYLINLHHQTSIWIPPSIGGKRPSYRPALGCFEELEGHA